MTFLNYDCERTEDKICGSKAVQFRRSVFDLIPMESGHDFGNDSYEKMPSMKHRKRQRGRRTKKQTKKYNNFTFNLYAILLYLFKN